MSGSGRHGHAGEGSAGQTDEWGFSVDGGHKVSVNRRVKTKGEMRRGQKRRKEDRREEDRREEKRTGEKRIKEMRREEKRREEKRREEKREVETEDRRSGKKVKKRTREY